MAKAKIIQFPRDRRQHERVPFRGSVHVMVHEWSALETPAHDISYGGMRISLPHRVERGDRIQFMVEVPKRRPFTLEAEVCHVAPATLPGVECIAGLRWLNEVPHAIESLGEFEAERHAA